jgi:hypothetical protein
MAKFSLVGKSSQTGFTQPSGSGRGVLRHEACIYNIAIMQGFHLARWRGRSSNTRPLSLAAGAVQLMF